MSGSRARLSRRTFLQALAALGVVGRMGNPSYADLPRSQPPPRPDKPRKRLAVVTTAYYYLSHAYHVCGRFLYGYLRDGKQHYPDFAIAGMHVEQQKDNDLSRELSKKHGFTLYPDVAGALTLGTGKLA